MADLTKILSELANAFGPSGFEFEVREVFRSWLPDGCEEQFDNLGSIAAHLQGQSERPRILLAAHLDEVGFMVRGILPSGYLKFVPLGSWWPPALLAQRVVVRSQHNGDHYGIIGAIPPHFHNKNEKKAEIQLSDLHIDLGVSNNDDLSKLGIEAGDPAVPAVKCEVIRSGQALIGKAFDDRAGCAVLIQVLRELGSNHPNLVIGAGTVQEENGIKGARTLAAVVKPDVAIILEGTPADDYPENTRIIQGRLGGGPQIRWLDPSMIANPALVKLTISKARELGLVNQVAVREGGGTDGSEVQLEGAGVPTVVIGVPVRYAHSHQGIVQVSDLEATVKLVAALVQSLDESTVERIKQNPW